MKTTVRFSAAFWIALGVGLLAWLAVSGGLYAQTCSSVGPTSFTESFESGGAGWVVDTAVADLPPTPTWSLINDPNTHSASHCYFSADGLEGPKDDRLVSPAQSLTPFGLVTFWHRFSFESGSAAYDGGVLEVSMDGGSTWEDLLDAGGSFAQGGYIGTISDQYSSPIAGRKAWTAGSPTQTAMTQVTANLGLINGSAVKFRWREASDASPSQGQGVGWFIDDVSITSPGKSTCPPVAVADMFCVVTDSATKLDVLANDTDPEGDPRTIVRVDAATVAGGAAAIDKNGTPTDPSDDTILFTPMAAYEGPDFFNYVITDGHGNLATGTVSVNVAATCVVPGLSFYSFSPCRILDTRVGGQGPALTAGTARALPLTGGTCAVPADCKAMSLNITVISPTGNGDLVLYPEPGAAPGASSISFPAGKTRANNAVAGLASGGDGTTQAMLRITGGGSADLIVDENGCFK